MDRGLFEHQSFAFDLFYEWFRIIQWQDEEVLEVVLSKERLPTIKESHLIMIRRPFLLRPLRQAILLQRVNRRMRSLHSSCLRLWLSTKPSSAWLTIRQHSLHCPRQHHQSSNLSSTRPLKELRRPTQIIGQQSSDQQSTLRSPPYTSQRSR